MKGSDNPFPSVLLVDGAEPAAPAAGHRRLYVESSDGTLRLVDPAGAEDVLAFLADLVHDHDADYAPAGHTHAEDTTVTATQEAGTAYTLDLADAGTVIEFTAAGAVTVTVPDNATVAFPIGTVLEVYAAGAGGVTVAAGTGVTVRNAGALAQYGTASLRKRATDEWVLTGAVT